MSRMKIVSPLTGAYIEKRIPLQWTRRGKRLMYAMVVGLVVFAYLAVTNYLDEQWPSSGLFGAYAVFVVYMMYKLYRHVRLYSNMNAQYQEMLAYNREDSNAQG
jgi:hypothetical protein